MTAGNRKILPSDDWATITTAKVTVLLSTSDQPYSITDSFAFETPVCLIYSEKIKLQNSLKLPGKSIGLFCNTLEIASGVSIDVSGTSGKTGDSSANGDGGKGGDGTGGGTVWLFVQNGTEKMLRDISIKAHGGDGGSGGDAGATGKTGGGGGKGGNGGNLTLKIYERAVTDYGRLY